MPRGAKPQPPMPRFLAKVDVQPNGCWYWTAARRDGKHGFFTVRRGQQVYAHVWAYEQWVGPVPAGKILDHYVCDTPYCVNPHHVTPTTHRENILRGTSPSARNARKTHCNRGHEFTEANTRHANGKRHCRACGRDWMRSRRASA